jgi:hypothetical protein
LFGKDKEKYNTSKDKSPIPTFNEGIIEYAFEISGILKNGEIIFDNAKYINLFTRIDGSYAISPMDKNRTFIHKFFTENELSKLYNFTYSNIETFRFEGSTGILFIDDDKNDHYEIQLKFKSQIVILHHFLNFVHLRQIKINDKTIQEIQLKNHSEKIMLEKNNIKLHENEEILSTYYLVERGYWTDDDRVDTISTKFVITNFRIMQDVWCYPVLFDKDSSIDIEKILSDSIVNFTHDEYDDVFASKVTTTKSSKSISRGGTDAVSFYGVGVNQELHSYEGTSEAKESGDIIFMSKGKKFCTWDNFVDPKGIVEMIKSAKSQFESQDEKIPQPVVSSSDDNPLKILKMRLAKGEITLEEFKEIKENLV